MNKTQVQGKQADPRWRVVDGKVGAGVQFERIRRITGYLVGSLDRFNNAKKAEVGDRVKHISSMQPWGQKEEQ